MPSWLLVMSRVWFYDQGSWDWSVAKSNREHFGGNRWRENFLWSIGCDEKWRRTLVVRLPRGAVVFAISRPHPEWEHKNDWELF
jgi:hypothetical protein